MRRYAMICWFYELIVCLSSPRMWTWLDMFIVLSSTWELAVEVFQGELESLVGVSSLKALRIIRLTRIFKTAQVPGRKHP